MRADAKMLYAARMPYQHHCDDHAYGSRCCIHPDRGNHSATNRRRARATEAAEWREEARKEMSKR